MAKKIIGLGVSAVILIVFALGYKFISFSGPVGAGFVAGHLCAGVFVAKRDFEEVQQTDLDSTQQSAFSSVIDYKNRSVTTTMNGPFSFSKTAVFRDCLGCTILVGISKAELQNRTPAVECSITDQQSKKDQPWPTGDKLSAVPPAGVNQKKLSQALDDAFLEPDPEKLRSTRAVVVVYDGHIIAERYAPGISKDTALHGWSMTKSITSALIGILVKQGKLSIDRLDYVPEWQSQDDPHSAITLNHVLQMTSGIEFSENYGISQSSDVEKMLFDVKDTALFAIRKPLEVNPGSRWQYATGNSCILGRIVRDAVGDDMRYYNFPRRELFSKIGMSSATLQTDSSGTFNGGAWSYLTARDWARFGLLYLNDGVWEGERILPAGWVDYTRSPAPASPPDQQYGAQFWLNTGGEKRWMPSLPEDLYAARGHFGQTVNIIPSKKLVIVRLGQTYSKEAWNLESFIGDILKAIPE